MAIFEVRNRAYSDNSISEVAGKLLPLHPTARYNSFTDLWKKTRKVGGYIPRPKTCITAEDDLFPCCLSCAAITDPENVKELLARRSANAGWITADWWWDFGWLLPAGFVNLGIGVTVPSPPVERDRVFVHKPNLSRGYLDLDLAAHAKVGADQHEARARVSAYANFEQVAFEGQMLVSVYGDISVAVPRSLWFGDGKEVWQRFIFQNPVMPYELSNLVLAGNNMNVEDGKVVFMGVEL
ncbi:hypothetical protein QUB37_03915 [Microcoleus sp. AT3-A2]|uniref:hypothetical protein n=1 Tax=Microcoleus sp. AT3-A2 TaxID=2818610 RepID=UPI002FD0AE5C